ncbi:pyridoxal-phosphate dependent enzyme, partial [Streptomyces sp. SID7803]|nr:pyridoxal-phosphate dependent enzyme [Streptomyces sp. SID7803]
RAAGQDRARQDGPGARARRKILQVDGNFDDCLTLARSLSDNYPVALVNSVNPVRIEGQKTAAFEIVDALGDAPDIHVLPVGNAGNITAYWKATPSTPVTACRRTSRACGASRPPAPRPSCAARSSRTRRPSPPPSGSATRPPGTSRSPRATSRAASSTRSRTVRSCPPTGCWPPRRRLRRARLGASVAGLLKAAEEGKVDPGQR